MSINNNNINSISNCNNIGNKTIIPTTIVKETIGTLIVPTARARTTTTTVGVEQQQLMESWHC